MPWQSNVFPFIIITGPPPNTGLYVYSPTPGKNNLVETAGITTGGHDAYGNVVLAGDTQYMNQAGTYYALQAAGGAGSVPLIHWWVSNTDQTGTYSTLFVVGLAISAGLNGIDLGSAASFANPPACFSAPLLAQSPAFPATGAEVWHTISLAANWSTIAGEPVPSYRLLADGTIEMVGSAQHSTAFAVSTQLSSGALFSGAYIPATNQFLAPASPNVAGVQITSAGIVNAIPPASVTVARFNGTYPVNL